ncbi:VOC family protein [Virgisporangium aliadipatigenens]|uniref:VOC family protein n=1 Tax=Virgisporangium aliadipatigenens TaxID=741659 RepID=A0A8J3YPI8_9ACTN|nr:VOC family protein [Virgisporangium aliadipatigenens]GIJ49036.1 VOC family protein [Virgisporangium aliadipatigenens]
MSVTTAVHLNFRGDARAALEFYADVAGGQPVIVTYKDSGAVTDPAEADQVIWGQVRADNGFHVMAFDVPAARPFSRGDASFYVSLRGDSREELTALWEKLSDGGTVVVPFGPSQWAPLYGMVTDRFGITWVLDIAAF